MSGLERDERRDAPGVDLLQLVGSRRGHFLLESGYHGETWLDLDSLFLRPAALDSAIDVVAHQIASRIQPDAICGPLFGGALIAHAIAARLDLELYVADPVAEVDPSQDLFQARYAVGGTTRSRLARKRVVVVDDVINAGSATRATVKDLQAAGAAVAGIGALLVLGTHASEYAEDEGLPLVHATAMPNRLWLPADCPLCASGVPIEDTSRF